MEAWVVSLLLFGLTQLGTLLWVLATLKGELKTMQKEIDGQGKVLERHANIIEEIANQRREIALIQERQLLQGKRLDTIDRRVSNFLDRKILTVELEAAEDQ